MKITFLTPKVPPAVDGVGDYTFRLASALREAGHDAKIVCGDDQREGPLTVPMIRNWKSVAISKHLRLAVTSDWVVIQYVPQLYGKYGICWDFSAVPKVLKQKFHCRLAVTFHEIFSSWGWKPQDIALALIQRAQAKRLLAGSDMAITTCERYGGDLKLLAPRGLPVRVVPVGASVLPEGSEEEFRDMKKGLRGAFVFGVFGALSRARNIPTAVKTVDAARRKGLNAVLMFVGGSEAASPKLFEEIMSLARRLGVDKYVISTGELPPEKLSLHLRLVDLFLFPQRDGISTRNTTVMSALAHGIPVVSYEPVPGNFPAAAVTGIVLVPRGAEEKFIHAACETAKGARPEKSAIVAAYESRFSWKVIADAYSAALGAERVHA